MAGRSELGTEQIRGDGSRDVEISGLLNGPKDCDGKIALRISIDFRRSLLY